MVVDIFVNVVALEDTQDVRMVETMRYKLVAKSWSQMRMQSRQTILTIWHPSFISRPTIHMPKSGTGSSLTFPNHSTSAQAVPSISNENKRCTHANLRPVKLGGSGFSSIRIQSWCRICWPPCAGFAQICWQLVEGVVHVKWNISGAPNSRIAPQEQVLEPW
jgi:hypothetical protein